MIALDDLTKRFGRRTILDRVTARFARGEIAAVVGASGSGKSTLLRCINGLERFEAGAVRVADVTLGPLGAERAREERAALAAIRREVGMVFQHFGLFAHMSALANVMEAPVHVRGVPPAEARDEAEALLARVGLAHRSSALPRALSGGEQQRVAIARALAMRPSALLLDEPTSALDPERTAELARVLESLARDGTTMLLVSHDHGFVRRIAHRALALRDGRVEAEGAPSEALAAASCPA